MSIPPWARDRGIDQRGSVFGFGDIGHVNGDLGAGRAQFARGGG